MTDFHASALDHNTIFPYSSYMSSLNMDFDPLLNVPDSVFASSSFIPDVPAFSQLDVPSVIPEKNLNSELYPAITPLPESITLSTNTTRTPVTVEATTNATAAEDSTVIPSFFNVPALDVQPTSQSKAPLETFFADHSSSSSSVSTQPSPTLPNLRGSRSPRLFTTSTGTTGTSTTSNLDFGANVTTTMTAVSMSGKMNDVSNKQYVEAVDKSSKISKTKPPRKENQSTARPRSGKSQKKELSVQAQLDKLAERRRRNRESSSRCYYNRKRIIEGLEKQISAEKMRLTSLYDRALELRHENARLKKDVVLRGIALPSSSLVGTTDLKINSTLPFSGYLNLLQASSQCQR